MRVCGWGGCAAKALRRWPAEAAAVHTTVAAPSTVLAPCGSLLLHGSPLTPSANPNPNLDLDLDLDLTQMVHLHSLGLPSLPWVQQTLTLTEPVPRWAHLDSLGPQGRLAQLAGTADRLRQLHQQQRWQRLSCERGKARAAGCASERVFPICYSGCKTGVPACIPSPWRQEAAPVGARAFP